MAILIKKYATTSYHDRTDSVLDCARIAEQWAPPAYDEHLFGS